MNDLKDIFKKFSKNKNSESHRKVMLIVYAVFIVIVILLIRLTPSKPNSEQEKIDKPSSSETPITTPIEKEEKEDVQELRDYSDSDEDINYSFSYKINYNGEIENYLGKRVSGKQKFTYIKGNISKEYAYINDNFLELDSNGIYHIADSIDSYFKYCDTEKIVEVIADLLPQKFTQNISYNITSQKIADAFDETIPYDDGNVNIIEVVVSNGNIKGFKLDLSNYISIGNTTKSTLKIEMELADIGKVEDFKILYN